MKISQEFRKREAAGGCIPGYFNRHNQYVCLFAVRLLLKLHPLMDGDEITPGKFRAMPRRVRLTLSTKKHHGAVRLYTPESKVGPASGQVYIRDTLITLDQWQLTRLEKIHDQFRNPPKFWISIKVIEP